MGRAPLSRPGAPLRLVRPALAAALLLSMAGWVIGLPEWLGLALYGEQYLALSLGLSTAIGLMEPPRRGSGSAAGTRLRPLLAMLALAGFSLIAALYPAYQARLAMPDAPMMALAGLVLAMVLLAVWHRLGPVLPLLLAGLAAFTLWIGPELPERFATRPADASRLAVYLAFDTNGLLSRLLNVAAVTVAPFILFGVLLGGLGAGEALARPMMRLAGGWRGGTAKVSVLGSAVFGMVSGSAVANVTTMGGLTIPMMIRAGQPPHRAAAIEAVGSTGGQLMPPIMGALAFLRAEFPGLSYGQVVLAALVPALLYFAALLMAVDFSARRVPTPSGPATETDPGLPANGVQGGWRPLPALALLLWLLFGEGMAPGPAGLWSVAALAALHLAGPSARLAPGLARIAALMLAGARAIADLMLLAAAAALMLGLLAMTGTAFVLSLVLLDAANGAPAALLAMTAGLALLLGLGMPTVGVYVMAAGLAAPALVRSGLDPITAHLFVLYFGMLSMITPPVALASFSAALIADAPAWRTALAALRLGAGAYAVPLAFVARPALLDPSAPGALAQALLPSLMAIALVTAASVGHAARPLHPLGRVLALTLGLGLIGAPALGIVGIPALAMAGAGLALLVLHLRRAPAAPAALPPR